ncbi:MAG TPA: FHA domain-containing protein [Myxococcota bacterium]|nr:FHA domain-containing protein [Myxococcota bacterium]
MPGDRTSLLFCPPLAPLRLAAGARVAIGRGRDCELNLINDSASRRHAEVYADGAEFLVRDLGSKNGTFVNGTPVTRPVSLRPGDRIGVGTSTITYCVVEGSLAGFFSDPEGHETLVVPRAELREVFRGELVEIPIFVVMQMLEMGHKSGLLLVETEAGPVKIWLGDGQPLHAETEKVRGLEAAMVAVAARRGAFRFEAAIDAPERTLLMSMTELLLEASRRIDESQLVD